MNNPQTLLQQILADRPYKLVMGKPASKSEPYKKIQIDRKENYYQLSCFTEKQVFHENKSPEELLERCMELLGTHFLQLYAWSTDWEYALLLTKKGDATLKKHKKKDDSAPPAATGHNREKHYLLKEGTIIPPLVDMGIFTKEGRVVASMQDKFRQINRFIELLDDTLKESRRTSLNIIDFGCGKSYLTFIVYYYLTEIRHMTVEILGLDLKEDVIRKCNQAAEKYGYSHLHFALGDINGFLAPFPVDMVLTLHACDTATDYALYNAIQWNAGLIFSVPCCQHEVNHQLQPGNLAILSRYGIVKERFSALLTDAIRGNLLTAAGYKTQLLEFVDLSHTPKNIMIRAVRSPMLPASVKNRAREEIAAAIKEFHVEPTLYRLLR